MHEIARVICEEQPENLGSSLTREDNLVPTDGSDNSTVESVFESRNASREALQRELSGDLERIVFKALRKDSVERYQSAAELAEDILRYLEGQPVLAADSYPSKAVSPTSVHKTNADEISVAVLPLKLFGATHNEDTGDDYLCIGLADALITRLSNVRRFIVRPTSSVLKYGNNHTEPIAAGAELGVNYVIDGNIRRVGETLRVTVQLLSIEDGATRWARRFDEKITDFLTLEDVISEQIVSEILPQLTGEEEKQLKKRGTNNNKAHEAYLRGRYFWNKFTGETLPKAFESFSEAIALDPNYAVAFVGLADYYIWLCIFGFIPSPEAFPKAKEAAQKALEIDDKLGEGYASLGFATLLYDWDWQRAESLFKRAIELNPNYPFTHEWYSNLLTGTGRFEEGLKEIRRAEELNPLSARSLLMTSWTLYQMRRYKEAIEKAEKALELDADLPQGLLHLGNELERAGRASESVEVLEKSCALWEGALMPKYMLCYALVAAGRIDDAHGILDEIRSASQYVKPYFLAMAYNAVGESDEAFDWLEKAFAERSEWLIWLGTEPKIDLLREDPRYFQLLERMNNPIISQLRDSAEADEIHQSQVATKPWQA